jgi:hypothetical protein
MRRIRAAVFLAAGAVAVQSCGSSTDTASKTMPNGGTGGALPEAGASSTEGGMTGAGAGGLPGGGAAGAVGESGASGEGGAAGQSSALQMMFAWQVSYDQSYAAHVAVDSQGAAIVSGTFFDSKDITLGATVLKSHGAADVMLSRVLPNSDVDWARSYGAAGEDYPVTFVLDAQDRIFMTGLYNGTGNLGGPDFPPFMGTAGRYDASVAGFSKTGDPRWSHTINSDQEAFAGSTLAVDSESSVYVPGSYLGGTNIGQFSHTALGSWDAFFARYDEPDGALPGALAFGGTGEDRATAMLLTSTDLILIGKFSDSVIFPTAPQKKTLTSAGGTDVFIARVALDGTMTSVVRFGGVNDEEVTGARLDSAGRVVLAGTFTSPSLSVLGGKALQNAGATDFFVTRLSPALEHEWSVGFGGDAGDYVRDLAILPDDTLAITGEFRDHLQLGDKGWDAVATAGVSPTDIDFFVATLDGAGRPTWSYAAGGPGAERGLGIAADAVGGLYFTATFTSSIDFGGGKVLTAAAGQFASALVRYVP